MSATSAVSGIDFAIIGNTPTLLRWLSLILGALAEVRLLDDHQDAPSGSTLYGVVIDRLPTVPPPVAKHAKKLVVVLADPVQQAAESPESAGIGANYLMAVRRLIDASQPNRALVLSANELLGSGTCLNELLMHIGVHADVDHALLPALGSGIRAPLSYGRRALLFAEMRDEVEELETLTRRTFRSWRFGYQSDYQAASPPPATSLFYVGRRRDAQAPPGLTSFDEWSVLPVRLGPALDTAMSLTVLDPLSFPFDGLRERDRALPVAVRLPEEWNAADLIYALGEPLFEHLGPYDEVSVEDDSVFADLRRRYSWRAPARIDEADLAGFASRVAVSPGAPLRDQKARDRTLRSAALDEVSRALTAVAPGERPCGVVLAGEIHRWASLLPLQTADLWGFSFECEHITAARADYREWRFAAGLPTDVEFVHVAVSLLSLCDQEHDERLRRLLALFGALRVGGSLVVIDRFLEGRGGRQIGAPAPKRLVEEVAIASRRHAVLSHVRALRLTGDDLTGIGVFAFVKIGGAGRE